MRCVGVAAALLLGGCLVPPGELEAPTPPFGPSIDASRLVPLERRLRLQLNDPCPPFFVKVPSIVDHDTRGLRYRWVVNNNLPGTTLIDEDELPDLDPGTPLSARLRLNPQSDLDVTGSGLGPSDVPILSFFVTDAPSFEREAGISDPDQSDDLGLVPPGSGQVAEVTWTFTFSSDGSGVCPP